MSDDSPFSLQHFFQGKLGREEVSSACLAMLLEGSIAFRRHFFGLISPGDKDLSERPWKICVEHEGIDIRLESGDTILIIENKLSAGAKQVGQLLRYYRQQRIASPTSRIFAVYLAPRQVGLTEVTRLGQDTEFLLRPKDLAVHVSWDDVFSIPQAFSCNNSPLIVHTLQHIQKAIEDASTAKYSSVGERKIVRGIVEEASQRLKNASSLRFKRWSGKEIEEIYSVHTAISLCVGLQFKSGSAPHFHVSGVVGQDDKLHLALRTYVGLAVKIKKSSPLSNWWKTFSATGMIDVPEIGHHKRGSKSFYEHTRAIQGSAVEITDALLNSWNSLETYISRKLAEAGFDENKFPRET